MLWLRLQLWRHMEDCFFSAGVEVGGSFLERQPGADDPNQAVYREFPTGVSATVTGEKTDRARIVFELPGGGKRCICH